MELYLDTADIKEIKRLNDILKVDGVTTNPAIICKSQKEPLTVIKEIIEILDDNQKLFVQTVSEDYDGILKEAREISKLKKKNMVVKIPVTTNGLKAIKVLSEEKITILATAIYTAESAFLAAKNGAAYLAPYVNRMDNYGDGVLEVIELQTMLEKAGFNTKITAASFKNVNQVHRLLVAGIYSLTLPVDVYDNIIYHPGAQIAVDQFSDNWNKTFKRKTFK